MGIIDGTGKGIGIKSGSVWDEHGSESLRTGRSGIENVIPAHL